LAHARSDVHDPRRSGSRTRGACTQGARLVASSQHFVTVGLRFIEAFNRNDLEACADLLHDDIEWYSSNQFLESETHIGRDDARRYLESLRDHLDEPRMQPED